MNTKLNFLKSAITRVENDHEFMAYTLKKYLEFEKISESELLSEFNCSLDNYYKLALCKVPSMNAADFNQRLVVIGEYTNIMTDKLNMVVKRVNTILKFIAEPSAATLMAARDKQKKKDDKE